MLHIGRNIFSLIVSRIFAGIILFLIYTRLAQYLGPEQAGQYGLLAAFLAVFSMFVDLGMHQLVIKKVSENKENASRYLNNFFAIQFVLGSIFMVIMAGFVYFADYPDIVKTSLYVTSLALLLSSLSLPFRSIINAFQKLTIIAQVNFFNSIINAAFLALAIVFRQDIFFLAFIGVAVSIFDLLVYGFVANKSYVKFRFTWDNDFIKKLLIATFPFTLLTFFSIYNRIDTIMLPHLRSFEETGYYAAAYKFWDVLAFFPAVVGLSLYPFFAERLSLGKIDEAKGGLETYTRYMIALAVPTSVGAFLVAKPLIQAFYGQEFLPAAPAMGLLVLAVSILFIYSPVNSVVISQQTKAATKVTGFTLAFNFVTNLIFIPIFGIVAAAATTVASELIQMISYSYITNKKIVRYRFFRHFVKPIIASIIMGLGLYLFLLINLWLAIGSAILIYLVALASLKFFHRHDWELFKAAIDIRKKVNP